MRSTNPTYFILFLLTLMGYSAAATAEPELNALPTNGQVQSGNITIEQTATPDQAVMNINQASEKGIVNWETFNVGRDAVVNFNQPSTNAVTLNRVTTANPSQIYGQINANGNIILANSSGIYFSPSASIEVGGIIATTHHISDDDFNNNIHRYSETTDAEVNNAGHINALESHVALLAPSVRNEGVIVANKGDIVLASGAEITLQFNDNNRLVKVNTTPSLYNSLVENKYLVEAPGGTVILSATAVNQINGGLIRQSGTINVGSTLNIVKNEAGRILLTSNKIEFNSESQTLADASAQGGEIIAQAKAITLAENATVSSSATDNGNGGLVELKASEAINLNGIIKADALGSGNGGQITSEAPQLTMTKNLLLSARAGLLGGIRGLWQLNAASINLNQDLSEVIALVMNTTNVNIFANTALCSGGCLDPNIGSVTMSVDSALRFNGSELAQLAIMGSRRFNLYGQIVDESQNLNLSASGFTDISADTQSMITASQVSFVATDTMELFGSITITGNENQNPLGQFLAANVVVAGLVQTSNSGRGGRLNFAGQNFSLASTGRIRSDSEGIGGDVQITAEVIDLQGYIQANGGSGRGGTINMTAHQVIDLNQAWIQTNGFDGGSINIISNTDSIIADQSHIQTNGSNGRGGTITLSANQDSLTYQGIIEANGYTQAGNITLTANHIQIQDGSHITATGHLGGGHIQIGGSWQNSNPNVHQAITNTVEHNVLIDASALTNGNGGEIVIWSDILNADAYTKVFGSVYAKGGSLKGNGGRIETSGPWLYIDGIDVSTHAVNGNDGDWLIDPDYNWGAINAERAATIVSGLESSNVLIYTQSNTDITISYAINSTSANTLTFQAGDDGNEDANILINADVRAGKLVFLAANSIYIASSAVTLTTNNSDDSGALIMSANYANLGTGAYDITKKLTVRTNGGNVYIGGGNLLGTSIPNATDWDGADFRGGLDIQTNGGNVQIRGESNNANGVYFATSNSIITDGGNIYIYGETNATSADGVYFASSTTLNSGTGTISIYGKNTQTTASDSGGVVFSNNSHSITSASTYHEAISIDGDGGRKSILLNDVSLNATGTGGGIELQTHTATTYGILMYGDTEILATSGYIRLFTAGASSIDFFMDPSSVFLGSKSSSAVTSSSSNITIRANLFNFSGFNPAIATSGTFTLEPVSTSDSFGQNVSTSWWSWNQNSQTLSGLTLGKSTNTRNIYHQTNTLTINGPVKFYGSTILNEVALTSASGSSIIYGQLSGSGNFTQTTGTLEIYTTGSSTYSGVIGGAASLTKTGSGTIVLSGANTYTSATSISAGTIQNGRVGALHDSSSLTVASGATWDLNGYAETVGSIAGAGNILLGGATLTTGGNNSSTTFGGVISETGGLTKTGTGVLTLSGSNTFTGNVNVNAGTLNLNSTGRLFVVGSWGIHGIVTVGLNATLQLYDFTASTGNLGYLSYHASNLVINGGTLEFTGIDGVMGESAVNDGANKKAFTVGTNGATLLNNTASTWSIWQDTNTPEYNPVYNGDLTFAGSGDFSFNDVIDGTTAITKNGTGSVTLTQVNTYTGTTSILAGSLVVSGQLGSGTYAANITNAGTLSYASSSHQTFSGVISGAGSLTKSGSGTLTLSGVNTFTGNITISSGNLTVSGQLGSGNYAGMISNAGTLAFSSNSNQFLTGVISGTGALTKSGTGILTLAATNTYTGLTTISAGTLQIGKADAISTSSSLVINGTLNLNGFDLTVNSLSGSGTISNYGGYDLFSGDNASLANGLILYLDPGNPLSYSGTGTSWTDLSSAGSNVTITGSPTYESSTGTFRFQDGKYASVSSNQSNFDDLSSGFTVFSIYNFGSTTNWERVVDFGAGELNYNVLLARAGTSNNLSLQVYNGTTYADGSSLEASNAISDGWASYAATINDSDSGALYKDGSSLTTGTVTTPSNADRNSLRIGESNWPADDQDTQMRLLLIYNRALTADEINDLHTATASRSNATLTVNNSSALTFSGSIKDNISLLSLTKTGTGALTLSGSSNYSGVTTISAGSITATHGSSLGRYGSGQGTTVSDGAMLKMSGGVTVAEPITINGTGISSKGAIYFESGNNTYSGAITLASDSTITSAAGNQTISGTIDGGYSLSIADAGGHWYQRGVIGGTSAPTNLTINGGIVDLYAAVTTSGAINVLASDYIYIEGNITITGASQNLYLKAVDEINQIGSSTIQTNGGSVVFWANSDGDSEEWDLIRIGAINTSGGHVWAGGSLFNTGTRIWNGLTVGAGYAYSSLYDAVALRGNIDTRTTADSSIGGDVWLAGESGQATGGDIASEGAVRTIYAGNGDIALITHSYRHYNTGNYQTNLATTGQISIAPISGADWNADTFYFNYGMVDSWFEGYSDMEQVHIYNFANIGGLNLGTYNGTGVDGDTAYAASNANGMVLYNGVTINGPIRVTGDDIYVANANLNFNTSSTSNADIIFKGQGHVVMETNVDFTTDGGDVILWGNTVNTSSGTANNEVDLRGSNDISTSGGKIVLAGGLDSNSDGIPDGYSYRSYDDDIRAADLGASVSLDSGGGDIILRGQGGGVGVGFSGSGTSVDSGTGTITIDGLGVSNYGVWFGGSVAINSDSTSATAINITGTSTNDYGIFADSGVANLLIQSTSNTSDTGDIIITGTGPDIGIGFDNFNSGYKTQILTVQGDITLNGEGSGSRSIWTHTDAGLYLGQRANSTAINGITPVASVSTGNINVNSVSGIVGYGAWIIKTGDASNVGGNVIIAADTDATNGGFIYLVEGLTVNTFGGNFTMGGGDTSASGYAIGTTYNTGYSGNGIRLDSAVAINTAGNSSDTGGDINIRGKGYASTWGAYDLNGIYKYAGSTDINSGTGKIIISGIAPTQQTNSTSVGFYIYGGTNHYFTSASPTSDAIIITGDSSSSSSNSAEGIWIGAASGKHEFVATGVDGGLTISAKAGTNDIEAMQINDPVYALANGGDIILQVESGSTAARIYTDGGGTLFLGSTAASNTNYDVTSSTSDIYFRSSGSIAYDALITADTNGGNFVIATDTNNSGSGTLNLRGGLDVETNGGDITLGGGNTSGTSYAIGENDEGWNEGVRIDDKLNLASGDGDILIQGKTSTRSVSTTDYGNAGVGIYALDSNGTINSGTGTITINGINQNATSGTTFSSGVLFALNGTYTTTITSANTTNSAIQISGSSTGTNGSVYGMELDENSPLIIAATGSGGGASLTANGVNFDLVQRSGGYLYLLANGGDINFTTSAAGTNDWYKASDAYIGSKASSLVTSSSSDINLTFDYLNWAAGNNPYVATTGNVVWQSVSSSFGQNVDSRWFNWNQNSQTMSSFTIGKTTNTSNVDIYAVTASGGITAYASTINTNGNLTTTAAAGHIKLLARDDISVASGITLTTSGSAGDVILAADTDNSSGGAISASGALTISTNGGDIILGGGDTSASDFTDGEGSNQVGIRIAGNVDFDSQGGDIALRGESTAGGNDSAGIVFGGLVDIQSGTGTIVIHGINSSSSSDNTDESSAISMVANQNHIIKSLNTASSAITITADASTSPGGRGLDIQYDIDIIASGVGGGITLNGYNSDARTWAINLGAGSNILANGGDINLNAYPDNDGDYGYLHIPGVTLGSKASSDVTSSSSNISLTADYFDLDGDDPNINTSGNVTIQPYSSTWTSFGDRGDLVRISDFTFNDNNSGGEVVANLTIGKSTNSQKIIVDQSISVAGNVYLLAPANTSTSDITIDASRTITTTGDNKVIVIAAGDDFDNNSGASALVANGTGSRWIVYSADDNISGNFGSLDSNNTAVFGETYSSLSPASVASGNRYVFAENISGTTISFVTQDETITYGGSLVLSDNYVLNYSGGAAALSNVHDGSGGGSSGTTTIAAAYSSAPTITISASGSSISSSGNINVGSYSLTVSVSGGTLNNGYQEGINSNTGTLTVTQKALTISGITASNKTYDGNTSATIDVSNAVFTGLVAGDAVTVAATGTFDTKNVGVAKTVTLVETNAGADVNNYNITDQGTSTANITAAPLTISGITASNKTYDGNTSATIDVSNAVFTGLVAGDAVTVAATGTFDTKNVGVAKTVTLVETNAGADVNNYNITDQGTSTANITAAPLTISGITASNKTYDGNTSATIDVSNAVFTGLVAGDAVTVAATGTFDTKNVGVAKTVTLVETNAGADVNNYNITDQGTSTANITAAPLTISGITASNKTYDGNTSATIDVSNAVFTGLVAGDAVTVAATGTFDTKNVGVAKTVTLVETNAGADVNNYNITDQGTSTANITAKALTYTVAANDKVYDGNTTATATLTLSGFIGTETVTETNTATFNTKNVGTGKTVTVNSITLADGTNGGLASNYSIATGNTSTANITAKALTYTVAANDKVYDGNTTATATLTLSGFIGTETVTETNTATFNDKNVDTNKVVTVNTITLANGDNGGLASNYSIATGNTSTANITAAPLTISGITASNKTYDGNTSATIDVSNAVFTGLVAGDAVTVAATGTFDTKNVGVAKTVTLVETNAGADVNNYNITDQGTSTANITAAPLTISGITASNKTYDGNTSATIDVSNAVFTGLVAGDAVTVAATGTFDTKNVGVAKTVTLVETNAGADVNNYNITDQGTSTANITAAPLTISGITASNKTYDGNTSATIDVSNAVFTGLVAGDAVTVAATGTFDTKNVGVAKTVTLVETNAGADVNNYNITDQGTSTANITAAPLTISGITASNKTYDGNTSATIDVSNAVFTGLVAGDAVTVAATGTFDTKNVGVAKTVTLVETNAGADVNNYNITDQGTSTANITAKALTYTVAANDKVYDGNTTATATLTLSGFIGTETVTETNTATFNTKNVGTGKTVTVNSITLADGTNGGLASNYSIATGNTSTANITAKALTYTVAANDKVYDGNTTATATLTLSGFIGTETVTETNTATFNDKNVDTNKVVTVNTITLANGDNGGLASNYSIATGNTSTANITAAPLTISGITASNKTYDGNTSATIDVSNAVFTGLVAGDAVTVAATGTFDTKNVGVAKTVTLVETNAGADVNNYNITDQGTSTANITAAPLTISGITASNKTYDGNTSATIDVSNAVFTGLVAGDAVTVAATGTFDTKNVGVAKTVTLVETNAGADVNNYNITDQGTSTANITAAPLTISGITASNKTYDGNTSATIDVSNAVFTGLVAGDAVTVAATGTFDTKNVGVAKTVTLVETNAGADVNNYNITDQGTSTANITAAPLTISGITASNKTYDGNTSATIDVSNAVFTGLVAGDAVTVAATGTFDTKNVGVAKTVTLVETNAGADVNNYNITDQGTSTANITAKALTYTVAANDKVYDGNTTATATLTLSGFIGTETVTETNTATFNTKNVGTGKTVTVNSITLADGTNGGLASNYSIATGNTSTANITAKALTYTVAANDKVYDGNTTATATLTLSGFIGTETVTETNTATFNDKNVDTNKVVTVNTITLANGDNGGLASNYSIATGNTSTANITAAPLTISGITASNKTYDGNTSATIDVSNAVFTGLVAGDAVTVAATGTFDTKNVGVAKTVTLVETNAGADVNNYNITDQGTSTANITAAPLTISGITASNKTYDGNTSATIDVSNAVFTGLVAGDAVTVAATGTFDTKNVGVAKTVTLVETNAGADVNNYNITDQGTSTANITAAPLTISGITASNKTYDGNTSATIDVSNAVFTGLVAGDAVTVAATGTFDTKNVGVAKTVTLVETNAGADVNNYNITDQGTSTANITAKALTYTVAANDKVYDGNTTATATLTLSGFIGTETVTETNTATFNTKNVGTGKTVTVNSITLADGTNGGLASNYSIATGNTSTANITAKALTYTVAANDKVYDGNTTATATLTLSGFIGTETVTETNTATFNDKNVDTNKVVTVNTITLANGDNGGLASNYSIATGNTSTANITAAPLTISGITASNKTYDGNTSATIDVSNAVFTGLVAGDAVTVAATGTFDTKNVGVAKTVTLVETNAGADVNNYNITDQGTSTANITAKALTYTVAANDKVYDGNTTATATLTLSGFIGTETVTETNTATFNTKNVGTGKTVTVNSITLADGTNGGLASNYSIATGNTSTANITAKALTYTVAANDKVYDGNTTATATLTLSGFIGTETVTETNTATFNDKNVDTNKVVTVNTITLANGDNGGLASNYSIATGNTSTANITAAPLTISGITASNKTYDGNTSATIDVSNAVFTGLVAGDAVTVAATGTFDTKNVGVAKTVTLVETNAGADVNNYNITDQGTSTANITAKALTYTVAANDKVYDGNTTATATLTLSGFIGTETVTETNTATFNTKNVGTGKTVTVNSITLADGTNGGLASNYSIATGNTSTANITAKALTYTVAANDKVYDGNTTATATLTLSGFIGTETVTETNTATFNDKNVDTNKVVTVNTITLANGDNGGLASNYSIATGNTSTANITAAPLTISGITASNKTYDGNTSATIDVSNAVFTGLVAGDAVTVAATGTFDTKNVGVAKTVTLVETNAGADVNNYNITDQGTSTANITAAPLTISGITASNKTYDGNTSATIDVSNAVFTGLVAGDAVTVAATGTFDTKNVGVAKTVTLVETNAGADVNNYNITDQGTSTANITAAPLTISGITASNKTYDGNTSATIDVSNAVFTGLVAGDAVTVAATGTFDTKNVGVAKTVTLVETNAGADVNNYNITDQGTSTANITAAPLTISGITASNKTYDGNTSATIDVSNAVFTGLVAGDAVTVAATGTFDTKNVGVAKTVTLVETNAGADVNNYNITDQGTSTANITAKALTYTVAANDKTYNGYVDVDTSITLIGLVGSENLVVSRTATFDNQNAGAKKTVTVNTISIANGSGGGVATNYSISSGATTTASIAKATLTVKPVNSAKFGNDNDPVGYGGVIYTGFVAGETSTVLSGSTTISRAPGTTSGNYTLSLSETLSANNYSINYGTGIFTIADTGQVILEITQNTNLYYGSFPTYNTVGSTHTISARDNSRSLDVSVAGHNTVTVSNPTNSAVIATFTLKPENADSSGALYYEVGGYNFALTTEDDVIVEVGEYSISPLAINVGRDVTLSNLSKVYDGNATISDLEVTLSSSPVKSGDMVTFTGAGMFDSRHVGVNKAVTINLSLTGADANNYSLSNNGISGNIGTITQATSATWTGNAGNGLWSTATNWLNNVLPDQNNAVEAPIANVEEVIIPVGAVVEYNYDFLGEVDSKILNRGQLTFKTNGDFDLDNLLSGAGTWIYDAEDTNDTLTLSNNNNTISGQVNVNNHEVVLAANNALGTAILIGNDATLTVTEGVTLNQLTTQGRFNLASHINATGAITFGGDVLIDQGNGSVTRWIGPCEGICAYDNNDNFIGTFPESESYSAGYIPLATKDENGDYLYITLNPQVISSSNGNITFNGEITAGSNAKLNARSLSIEADEGSVTLNDRVGLDFIVSDDYDADLVDTNLYQFSVTADTININADIMTFENQTYNGDVLIGNNGNNGLIRTLLTVDPEITINGTVSDSDPNSIHTLQPIMSTLFRAEKTIPMGLNLGEIGAEGLYPLLVEPRFVIQNEFGDAKWAEPANRLYAPSSQEWTQIRYNGVAQNSDWVPPGIINQNGYIPPIINTPASNNTPTSNNTRASNNASRSDFAGELNNLFRSFFRNFVNEYTESFKDSLAKPSVSVGAKIMDENYQESSDSIAPSSNTTGNQERSCDVDIEEDCQ